MIQSQLHALANFDFLSENQIDAQSKSYLTDPNLGYSTLLSVH